MSKETRTFRDLLQEWFLTVGAKQDGDAFHFELPTKVLMSFGNDTIISVEKVNTIHFGDGYADIISEKNRTFTMLHRIVAVQVGEESTDGRPGFS